MIELQTQSVVKHNQSDLLVSTKYGRSDLLHFKHIRFDSNLLIWVRHSGGTPRKDEMGNRRLGYTGLTVTSLYFTLWIFHRFCSCDLEVDPITHTSLNLTRIRCKYTGCPNTDFLRQGFSKSLSDIHTDRQTDTVHSLIKIYSHELPGITQDSFHFLLRHTV